MLRCAPALLVLLLAWLPAASRISTAATARTNRARARDDDWTLRQFGIHKLAVDKQPEDAARAEAEKTQVEALVRDRLNELRRNPALGEDRDYQCFIGMDSLLDEQMQVVRGGLAVVVQKLSTKDPRFRVNFYRTDALRNWLDIKPLDTPVNRFFQEEDDVWVLRLLAKDAMNIALPNLRPKPREQGPRFGPAPRLTTFLVSGREQRIETTMLMPEAGEEFTFLLERRNDPMRQMTSWRCTFVDYTHTGAARQIALRRQEKFLEVEGGFFSSERKAFDSRDRQAFSMIQEYRGSDDIPEYRTMIRLAGSEDVLMTIGLLRHGDRYLGEIRNGVELNPLNSLYNILPVPGSPAYSFFSATTGSLVAELSPIPGANKYKMKLQAGADTAALLLTGTTLVL